MPALLDDLLAVAPDQATAAIDALSEAEAEALLYDWFGTWARKSQHPPPLPWRVWLILSGRGWGKSRTGAEMVRRWARRYPLVNIIGATVDDARDIMVEGESGILACCPPAERPEYVASRRQLLWPNGARTLIFTADEPERLRGKQHMKLWCLVSDTMVRMADGSQQAIQEVPAGALVQTSAGPRRVVAKGARLAQLVRVSFANGATLTGSLDHPIATPDGWRPLGTLPIGTTIYLWNDDGGRTLQATSTATSAAGNSIATAWPGKPPMVLSRPDTISTTRTVRPVMTGWTIWNSSAPLSIEQATRQRWLSPSADAAVIGSSMREWDTRRATAASVGVLPVKRSGDWMSEPAVFVDAPLPPGAATTVVSAVSILGRVGRVHNLTVEAPSDFYANGILTHNCDELAAWRYSESWNQAMFGLRLGNNPQAVVTTTPKPIPLIRELLAAPTTAVTRGSTYENRANLAPQFYSEIISRYEGTRLGRQELLAEVLEDVEGALWTQGQIDALRVPPDAVPALARIVVAIDPAVTSGKHADSTGIIVAGKGVDGHGYVLADLTCRLSPDGWARRAVAAYHEYRADRIIAEVNNGGDLVETTIRTVDRYVSYEAVHASRGKRVRAEPVAALYEQGVVHHAGNFAALEAEMCSFVPDTASGSPDRCDGLVWALSALLVGPAPPPASLSIGAARGWGLGATAQTRGASVGKVADPGHTATAAAGRRPWLR